jgi:hypothetical protein
MPTPVIVVLDEARDLDLKITRRIIVIEQNAVLERLGASDRSCPGSAGGTKRREYARCHGPSAIVSVNLIASSRGLSSGCSNSIMTARRRMLSGMRSHTRFSFDGLSLKASGHRIGTGHTSDRMSTV